MAYRVEKFSSTLKQNLADILLNEINNPHLKSVFISKVTVSIDLKKAEIFVFSSQLTPADLIAKLNDASGFIKKKLAQKMHLKYMPKLYFLRDDTYEKENEKESC
jgi:ribosome-binding factor A